MESTFHNNELKLDDIIIDDNLNVREGLDEDTIERYKECFEELPAVIVFKHDDFSDYILADGFHRYEAAKRLGKEEIEAEIRQGGYNDAQEYAALANLRHGKPLTRAERRKAVKRMLKLHPERANAWIADDMGVSDMTVKKYREELEAASQIGRVDKFIGKDGKEYPREIPHHKQEELSAEQVEEQPQETKVKPSSSSTEHPQESETSEVGELESTGEIPQFISKDEQLNGGLTDQLQEADEPEQTPLMVEKATTVMDEEQAEKQTEHAIYCNERFCSLDDIKKYIGIPVEIVTGIAGGAGVVKRGTILDIVEQEDAFMLDFETEDGEKQKLPTGTTTGKITDEGIVEIKTIQQPQEALPDEVEYLDPEEAAMDTIESQPEEIPETRYGDNERATLGNPQGWDTFIEHFRWVEDYSFLLAANTNIDFIRRMHRIFELFVQKLEVLLEDLART